MAFTSPGDPYRDIKKYHFAAQFNDNGGVSALCFKQPRRIDLNVASWTIEEKAVTCKKCLRLLADTKRLNAWIQEDTTMTDKAPGTTEPEWLTADEACDKLRCKRNTLTTLVRDNKITFTRINGHMLRFRPEWVDEYLAKGTQEASP